ncbi:hypothetical protein [Halorussus halophilus]|uniref:hypothetical protein n=1 Tax=Halorussus halophilus TaxID=2650975 RepID=UPI001300D3F8|nr:hypothetical protein [Halorussus halophilus]
MVQSQLDDTLEEKVNQLGKKAEQAEQAQSIEAKVNRARDNIQELGRELDSLDTAVSTLLFYDKILTDVFGDERHEEVDQALRRARDDSEISDEDVLDAAEDRETSSLTWAVDDARQIVRNARSTVIEEIREHQRYWEDEIESARDLNQIIDGGSTGFDSILDDMESFLDSEIWDEDKNPSSLASRWNLLQRKWEQNAGKHGWDSFQGEHGLSDETVAALQQFADHGSVRLDQLSVSVIKEMKAVNELESAIRLEIDTQ